MASVGVGGSPDQQEVLYYQTLQAVADPNRQGFVDAKSGAELLRRSGLPQPTLATIWNIADESGQGFLSAEQLFVAFRLVAHAQQGMPPTPELIQVRPQMLPEFEGVMRDRRGTSEISGPSARSDPSDLRPAISGDQASIALQHASRRQRSHSPPRPFTIDRWKPSLREKKKYASLFLRMDSNADGYVEGSEAKQLLERSGLDQATLGVVWDHADVDRDGRLSFPEFVALVHQVTCARRGARLPGAGEGLPQELLIFLQQLNETPQQLHSQRSRSSSRVPSPSRSPSPIRWTPTQRHKRKYASLFLRADSNRDGYVEAEEAKQLLERAGLESAKLGHIWELADTDHDGRFTFPEFVALVHLVSCVRRGLTLPGLTEGLPQELWSFLASITETPEELDRQRSRSRSRSPSPFGTSDELWSSFSGGGPSSGHLSTSLRESNKSDSNKFDFETSPGSAFDTTFKTSSDPFGPPDQTSAGFGFDTAPADLSGFPPMDSASSKKKGEKKGKRHDAGSPSSVDAFAQSSPSPWDTQQPSQPSREHHHREHHHHHREHNHHQDQMRTRSEERLERLRREEEEKRASRLREARQCFEALITADRAVSQRVRTEVIHLERELQQVRNQSDELGQQVQQKQQDIRRTEEARRQMEPRLERAKQQLADIREDRREMNLEDLSIKRDHEHFQEEIQWLQRMMAEEAEKLQECVRNNQTLDRIHRGLEVQTEQLEKQRREFMQEVAQEEADLRKELRHNAEMLTRLQRMRRERHIEHHGRQEALMKEERFRQMQARHSPASTTAAAGSRLNENGHSWALHVSTPSDPRSAWVS